MTKTLSHLLPLLLLPLGLSLAGCSSAPGNDDDTAGDDDDTTGDDDDTTGDDDDTTGDDDTAGDDDDTTGALCLPDANEEDNEFASATPVPMGVYDGLTACDEDPDFFAVTLTQSGPLFIDIYFTDADGDIDLRLYDNNQVEIASSTSATDNENIQESLDAGTYYVEVELYSGALTPGNTYTLELQDTIPPCPSDPFEPNNSVATAATNGLGVQSGLSVCEFDDDYYSVGLSAGEILTVDATFLDAEGDIDVGILDANEATLSYGSSLSDNESVTYTAASAETVTVRVFLYADAGTFYGNNYDLSMVIASP